MKFIVQSVVVALAVILFAPALEPQRVVIEVVQPTPEPAPSARANTISGVATWYDATKNNAWYTRKTDRKMTDNQQEGPYAFYAAAGPALRDVKRFAWNMKPYQAIVTSVKTGRSIVVWVVDWCQCRGGKNEKTIDLSPSAFEALGLPLGHGVMRVEITVIE
jgi:rare lipoprotein A (peptidoglycan hydrolase)